MKTLSLSIWLIPESGTQWLRNNLFLSRLLSGSMRIQPDTLPVLELPP